MGENAEGLENETIGRRIYLGDSMLLSATGDREKGQKGDNHKAYRS